MKSRFINRVKIERKVLRLINDGCGMPSLNGLTGNAIASWQSVNSKANDEIAEILRHLSKKAQIEADASRDVFDAKELAELSSIDDYLSLLKGRLRN
jgi:hypothetical protein